MSAHPFEFLRSATGVYDLLASARRRSLREVTQTVRMVAGWMQRSSVPTRNCGAGPSGVEARRRGGKPKFQEGRTAQAAMAALGHAGSHGGQAEAARDPRDPWFKHQLGDGFYHYQPLPGTMTCP